MKDLVIFLAVMAVPAAIGLYFFLKPRLVEKGRDRLRKQPVAPSVQDMLSQHVGLYAHLPEELRQQLHGHVNVFLDEKRFLGMAGQEITSEVAVTIAGNACILLLNRKPCYFPGFSSILVYPDVYEADHVHHDGTLTTEKRTRRAGESWHRGPIVLSWSSVLHGTTNAGDGYNVVLHEFAHKLDEQNNGTNGQPILYAAGHYDEWADVLGREYRSFADRVARGKNRVMDEYGLTSPAEFFAVATESFFEKPLAMQRRLPDLYEQLKKYYAVDPASWR